MRKSIKRSIVSSIKVEMSSADLINSNYETASYYLHPAASLREAKHKAIKAISHGFFMGAEASLANGKGDSGHFGT